MAKLDLMGVGPDDSDSVEELLERFNWYIVAQAEKIVFRSSNFADPAVLDLEIDEIVQNVRIKLWKASGERSIESPKAYIRQMVHNEFIDALRRRKRLLPLPIDEDGELYQGDLLLVKPGEDSTDPVDVIEQEEAVAELLKKLIDGVSTLPTIQQRAAICSLKDRVNDSLQLIETFRGRDIEVEPIEWPDDKIDVQRLKASLSAARKKLELYMEVSMTA